MMDIAAFPHLRCLQKVGLYVAPSSPRQILGSVIQEGMERIEILTGGRARFSPNLDDHIMEVGRGDILWHQPGQKTVHVPDPNDPYRCLSIIYETEARHPAPPPRMGKWLGHLDLDCFAREVVKDYHRDDGNNPLLGLYIYTQVSWCMELSNLEKHRATVPEFLLKVVEYIEQHLEKDLDIQGLAKIAGLSCSSLHLTFKDVMDLSPRQYIIDKRMEKARQLLVSDDVPIKSVCKSCGYADVANFGRVFKLKFGLTPGQYRATYTT